jgi:hypothetical protein
VLETQPDAAPLKNVYKLFMTSIVKRDLAKHVLAGNLSVENARKVDAIEAALCAKLGAAAMPLVDAFGLTPAMLSAPIAGDWVGYNQIDNQGEV